MAKLELPPSIIGKVRDRGHHRTNRIRIELSMEQGKWLSGLINKEIETMNFDQPEFRAAFLLYRSIIDQADKLK